MGEDLCAFAEDRLHAVASEDEDLAGAPSRPRGPARTRSRPRRDRGVRDQGQGRGRPDQQQVAGLQRRLWDLVGRRDFPDRQLHVDGEVLDVVVAEGDLVRAERGAAARAVGHDLVALVQPPVVPHPPQGPPARLDVVVLHRHVGVVEVDPEPDPLGQPVPLLHVAEDRLAAARVELRDPVLLDLGLRGDPQPPSRPRARPAARGSPSPPCAARVPGHRAVARVDVLEDAREDVARVRTAVRGRRTLVEAPAATPGCASRPSARRRRARHAFPAPPPRGGGTTAWGLRGESLARAAILRAGAGDRRGGKRGVGSGGQRDRAVFPEGPVRAVCDLPRVPVGVDEDTAEPPQKVSSGSRPMVAPAARACSITSSTSAGERALYANVTPPQPGASLTVLSSARRARSQSAITMPPAWKKTTSSSGAAPVTQPSLVERARLGEIGTPSVIRLRRCSMGEP